MKSSGAYGLKQWYEDHGVFDYYHYSFAYLEAPESYAAPRQWEVERITGVYPLTATKLTAIQYEVKWKNNEVTTTEEVANLNDCADRLNEFWKNHEVE